MVPLSSAICFSWRDTAGSKWPDIIFLPWRLAGASVFVAGVGVASSVLRLATLLVACFIATAKLGFLDVVIHSYTFTVVQ